MAKGIYIELADHPQSILDFMDQTKKEMQRSRQYWSLGCGLTLALVAVGALAFFLDSALDSGPILRVVAFFLWGVAAIVGVLLLRNRPSLPGEQFAPVRQLLHTLRDDTGRKGRVVGWLDMTGPRQKAKEVRTARSRSGKIKVYYRDPWFQAKIKLVDGNLLRLSLTDKVKTKAGSVVNHRSQFAAKLVVNPKLYYISATPPGASPAPIQIHSGGDGVLSLKAEVDRKDPPIEHMLQSLKAMYGYLEPISSLPVNPIRSLSG